MANNNLSPSRSINALDVPRSEAQHSLDFSPMKQNNWNRLEQLTGEMGILHEH